MELLARSESEFVPEEHAYAPPTYSPELHILDSEWYFTSRTSASLGGMVARDRVCLLGTPTVAIHIPLADYVLVDRSPYLLDRFPSLPPSRLLNVDVRGWTSERKFGAVILDPPWYVPDLGQWLGVALQAVELGGVVLLPLLGERTRPTAEQERNQILELLASSGYVEVLPDVVEYDLPLFEARALAAAGVVLSGPWRRADLAVARVAARPRGTIELAASGVVRQVVDTREWGTFLIGTQVVKLRTAAMRPSAGGGLLEPLSGVDGFTLDSVSRRDPRIGEVDIWSSRNRVARVLDFVWLARALQIMHASTVPVTQVAAELLRHGFSRRHIRELFDYLEMTDSD